MPEETAAEKALKKFKAAWKAPQAKIDAMNKAAWQDKKKAADIKKTKWFQSASAIGPKIDKVKSEAKSFNDKLTTSGYLSLKKSLETLSKECDDFWKKHKDAQSDKTVQLALDEYKKTCAEAIKVLLASVADIELIDKDAGAKNTRGVIAQM